MQVRAVVVEREVAALESCVEAPVGEDRRVRHVRLLDPPVLAGAGRRRRAGPPSVLALVDRVEPRRDVAGLACRAASDASSTVGTSSGKPARLRERREQRRGRRRVVARRSAGTCGRRRGGAAAAARRAGCGTSRRRRRRASRPGRARAAPRLRRAAARRRRGRSASRAPARPPWRPAGAGRSRSGVEVVLGRRVRRARCRAGARSRSRAGAAGRSRSPPSRRRRCRSARAPWSSRAAAPRCGRLQLRPERRGVGRLDDGRRRGG